jgi:hypothetical protein
MLSGRKAEAARNDQRKLDAARAVFVADPGAPVAPGAGPLPGSPPSWRELSSRWDG